MIESIGAQGNAIAHGSLVGALNVCIETVLDNVLWLIFA